MKVNFNARSWHNWISIILVLPIIIVGITAIFIAHHKTLKMEQIDVTSYVSWLPGYSANTMNDNKFELRSSYIDAEGKQWLGAQNGLYQMIGKTITPVTAIPATQVRDIAESPWGLMVASKMGIWINTDTGWQQTYKGDAWNISANKNNVSIAVKDKGILVSDNGKDWHASKAVLESINDMPTAMLKEPITLEKLNMDLHTGKAFFGKTAEWIWIDILGAVLVFLSGTGIYLWWRGEKRKKAALDA
jgi:hypothetical protein